MYSETPRARRVARAVALAIAAAALGAPAAQAEEYVPGVTDFPTRPGYVQEEFVPGVTDFPSRVGAKGEQAARERVASAQVALSPSGLVVDRSDFDWGAAGIGAGVGAAAMFLAAVALRTRDRTRVVRAH